MQDGGALARQLPHRLQKLVPRHEVKAGGGLVEHQHLGTRDQRARNQHAPALAGGHLGQRLLRQVQRLDALQGRAALRAHLARDLVMGEQPLRAQQPGGGGVEPRYAAAPAAHAESRVQIAGDDAHPAAQVFDVGARVAEDAQRGPVVARRRTRAVVERQHAHQRRLAGAVGAEDGRVLAAVNAQRQAVERARAPAHHGGVDELEDRLGQRVLSGQASTNVVTRRRVRSLSEHSRSVSASCSSCGTPLIITVGKCGSLDRRCSTDWFSSRMPSGLCRSK